MDDKTGDNEDSVLGRVRETDSQQAAWRNESMNLSITATSATKYSEGAFSCAGPAAWNRLPHEMTAVLLLSTI